MATLYTRWPPGLPHVPFAIGTEFSGTADLSHEILGPHHRRACHPSLAARTRKDHVQDRRAVVQSPPRKCAPVPGTPHACVRSARSTRTLRSADTSRLLVPPVKLSTVGSRAFPVAAVPASGTPYRKKSRHRHR